MEHVHTPWADPVTGRVYCAQCMVPYDTAGENLGEVPREPEGEPITAAEADAAIAALYKQPPAL